MPRNNVQTLWFVAAVLSLGSSCVWLRPARVPMPSVAFAPLSGPQVARGAIVILPGFGDDTDTFEERGFTAALRAAAPDYDLYGAEAHFGYYRKATLVSRLDADVIEPLRKRGYRELWLAGASMGGHGAVGFARERPNRISGLLLFAPYMGPGDVVAEVKRAGGLCKYNAKRVDPHDAESFARANFLWLREQACEKKVVSLWLAVGDKDRLLGANRLVGDALAAGHMMVFPGGHGWKVWTFAASKLATRAFTSRGLSGAGAGEQATALEPSVR